MSGPTWGQVDALREHQMARWDWEHQWTQLTGTGTLSRCIRCDEVNSKTDQGSKCRGDTAEQASTYRELFG